MAAEGDARESIATYRWTDEDTRSLILWRVANVSLFTGRRNAAVNGYETYIDGRGLVGRVTPGFIKKKWENLKQKYKDLKCPRTGVSTEGGETTAASWKWYNLMDEAIGGRPSVTPPVLIASSSQDVAVVAPPSVVTTERDTATSMTSTPKRRRVDVMEVLRDLQEKEDSFQLQLRQMEVEAREREATRKRQAAEREERLFQELREREERRDREIAAREKRFLAVLEKIAKK